jgi:hypothetical protein
MKADMVGPRNSNAFATIPRRELYSLRRRKVNGSENRVAKTG